MADHETVTATAEATVGNQGHIVAQAWRMVRLRGLVSIVAIYGHNADVDLTQFVRRQIDIQTSYASSYPEYLVAIELLESGVIPVDDLVQVYDLVDGIQGFKDVEQQAVLKPLLKCN